MNEFRLISQSKYIHTYKMFETFMQSSNVCVCSTLYEYTYSITIQKIDKVDVQHSVFFNTITFPLQEYFQNVVSVLLEFSGKVFDAREASSSYSDHKKGNLRIN